MCVCVCCKFVASGQDCQPSVGTVVTFYDLALEASCEGSYIYIRLLLPSSSLVLVLLDFSSAPLTARWLQARNAAHQVFF